MVKTTDTIELEGLDDSSFWELFIACVFDDGVSESEKVLLEIGKEIVKKLKGSPLAAKTVGRLLRNHLDAGHWKRVLHSKEWELQTGDHDIMPTLKLSYDYLPFHLQQCFSYCSLFPEDYKFDRKELIHWWIGLDILHSDGQNKSIEDIGPSYLKLVDHGFFKEDEIYGSPCYIIHDLLHDLGLKVSSRECLSIDHANVGTVEIWPSIRHLSIIIDGVDNSDEVTAINFTSELRIILKKKIED
uniref:Disease resistance protein winged helix domain-containing protein n=1 Tax=Arundo donax TaxID=35708 RepID=A0A0A9GX38_ARUDO